MQSTSSCWTGFFKSGCRIIWNRVEIGEEAVDVDDDEDVDGVIVFASPLFLLFVKRLKYRDDNVQACSNLRHGEGVAKHSLAEGRLSKYGHTKTSNITSISAAANG